MSPTAAQSQLSVVVDDKNILASVAFRTTKVLFALHNLSTSIKKLSYFSSKEVYSLFLLFLQDKYEALLNLNHTAPLLKRAGLPAAAALALSSASLADGSRSFSLNGSAGSQKVGAAVESRNLGWQIKRQPNQWLFLQISQEVTVTRTSDQARVKSRFKHTLSSLRSLGLPANVSAQVATSH